MKLRQHRPVYFPYEHCASVVGNPARVFILSATTVEALRAIMHTSMWLTRWAKEQEGTTRQFSSGEQANITAWGETIIEELMMPIDFCAYVAACIANAEPGSAVYIALSQFITNNFPPADQPPIGASGENILAITGCDPDNLFAQCRQLTQLIHSLNMDLFERIEQATNNLEAASVILDWVPIIGTVLEMVDFVGETMYENYEAEYTVAVENEIACKLWCAAMDNDCTLTWDDACRLFAAEVWESFPDTFLEVCAGLVTLSFTGKAYVYGMFYFMGSVLRAGGSFVNMSLNEVAGIMAAIANDTDSDWVTLCDDCRPWHATFDLTLDMSMFSIDTGQWTSGVGIATENMPQEDPDPDQEAFLFDYNWNPDEDVTITHAKCTIANLTLGTWSGSTSLWAIAAMADFPNMLASRADMETQGAGDYEGDINVEVSGAGMRQALYVRVARNYMDGHAECTTFELWGYGDPGAQFKSDATEFEYVFE